VLGTSFAVQYHVVVDRAVVGNIARRTSPLRSLGLGFRSRDTERYCRTLQPQSEPLGFDSERLGCISQQMEQHHDAQDSDWFGRSGDHHGRLDVECVGHFTAEVGVSRPFTPEVGVTAEEGPTLTWPALAEAVTAGAASGAATAAFRGGYGRGFRGRRMRPIDAQRQASDLVSK
jgi:hypothetical protein